MDSFNDFNTLNTVPKEENKPYFSEVDLYWGSQFAGVTRLTRNDLRTYKKKVTNLKVLRKYLIMKMSTEWSI